MTETAASANILDLLSLRYFETQIGGRDIDVAFPAIGIFNRDEAFANAERAVVTTLNAAKSATLTNLALNSPAGTRVSVVFEVGDYGQYSGQMSSQSKPGFGSNTWIVKIYLNDTKYDYFTDDGKLSPFTLQHLLNHELAHAFTSNSPDSVAFLSLVNLINSETEGGLPRNLDYTVLPVPHCFPANTPIQISLTSTAHISTLKVGYVVLAFDPKGCNAMFSRDTAAPNITSLSPASAPLVPARVTRLFSNVTDEWLVITAAEGECERLGIEAFELTVTPGHEMLDAYGRFRNAIDIVTSDAQFVREDGRVVKVQHERVIYSAATAHLYEEAEIVVAHTEGGLALLPQVKRGWKTYNFEVETYHTYVAGGFRVHNVSLFTPDQGSWGSLADQIAGQISNNVFGVNTLEGALGGSAVKTIGSTAADAAQAWSNGQNFDVSDHLVGRSVYNLAGGLGAFGGNMLMQDLISGLGIRGNAATALSQFQSCAENDNCRSFKCAA